MPRQVDINIGIRTHKAIASINKLIDTFKDLNKEIQKNFPDGKIKLEMDFGNLDTKLFSDIAKSFKVLGNGIEKVNKNIDEVIKNNKLFNINLSTTKNEINSVTNNYKQYGEVIEKVDKKQKSMVSSLMSSIAYFEIVRQSIAQLSASYAELTNATFNVGVAGQMNLNEIEKLNKSFTDLSRNVPQSASGLAQAVDDLIRTGRSYDDARKIIEEVAILSTASGDSLRDTAGVVTKVMVSLGISGDRVVDTLNTMHSTAIQTASDMGYLAEAFKNVAGTASVYVKGTGLAGEALDDYKQKVLDVSMASIGSLANLGLSASQSGTKVKNLFSRLSASEKVARNMFDSVMALNNVTIDGKIFDYESLSQMAQKDLPKALETMSKLYIEGKLSSQVLQKMFTARHFQEISNILLEINGDVQQFVNTFAKGVDYANDFNKNMFNVNEQFKQLKNNIFAITSSGFKDIQNSMTGAMMIFNESMKSSNGEVSEIATGLGSIATKMGTIGITSATMITALGFFKQTIYPLMQAGGGAVASTLPILTAVLFLLQEIVKSYYEQKKALLDIGLEMNKLPRELNKAERSIEMLTARYNKFKNIVKEAGNIDLSNELEKTSTMLDLLLKQSKDFYDVLEVQESWKLIDVETELKSIDEVYNSYVNQAQIAFNEIGMNSEKQMRQISEQMYYDFLRKSSPTAQDYLQKNIDIDFIEEMLNKYMEISAVSENIDKARESVVLWAKEQKNVDKSIMMSLLRSVSTETIDMFSKMSKGREEYDEQMKSANDNMINETNRVLQNSQDTILAYNKSMGYLNQELLKGFNKTGFIQIAEETYSGVDAIYTIMEKSVTDTTNGLINQYDRTISALTSKQDEISREASLRELTKEELAIQENLNKQLEEYKNKRDELSKSKFYIGKDEFQDLFKDIDYNSKTSKLILEVAKAKEMLNKTISEEPDNKEKVEFWSRLLDIKQNELSVTDKIVKDEKNRTKYQLKKISFDKESLDLETELEKIGKSKTQQAIIEYQYKLKSLELSKDIAQEQIDMVKQQIADFNPKSGKAVELFNIIGANEKDFSKMQSALNKFRAKYMKDLRGDEGNEVNSLFKLASDLSKYLFDFDKSVKQMKFTSVKELREELEKIPSLISETNKSLYEASNMGIVPRNQYFEKYVKSLEKAFEENKSRVYSDYGLEIGTDIGENIQKSMLNIDYLSSLDGNLEIIKSQADKIKNIFGVDISKITDEKELRETISKLYMTEVGKQEELNSLLKEKIKILDTEYEKTLKILGVYDSMSSVISKLGEITNITGLSDFGDVLKEFGKTQEFLANPENTFNLKDIDWSNFNTDMATNLTNALNSALQQMAQGGAVGSFVGGLIGRTQGASQAGALAGMFTGAMGSALTGWQGMAIQAGASLLGGVLDGSGDDQAEADKKTKESNKLYNKNTEALQDLADRMSSLAGGVDSLNSSLISAFSKIPTVANLNNVTDALTSMYNTMNKTRIFNDVAYQVTKTKSSKGFLGIGGGSTSWTETIEVSVQEMLNKYGFQGAIEDMTSNQLRAFSKWLDDFDMGDSDNFSILADAIEDYAESLDTMEKNIEKFFYDTTMESFEGISSLEQEELRQQIEDFYKDLGLQIDDVMSAQIDALAEQMSVMVTIMQDVRSDFVSNWREMGTDAGKTFVQSMSPYIDSMLTNISQIYYDVYFSDINDKLEDEFKNLSDKLVELKKQGQSLNWDNVAKELSSSFGDILYIINETKEETESFNTVLLQLQKQALESGLTLSEIFDLGLVTDTQQTVIDTFKDALSSSEADSAFTAIGDMVGDTIGEALVNKMIDNMMSDKILEMSAQLDKIVSGNMSFDSLAGLANEALSVGLMMENERMRLEAIKDMFSMGEITYQSEDDNIEYSSGVSQNVINNYYLSSNIEAGNVIESDSLERLADSLLDIILEKLTMDKGIRLK